MKSTTLLPFTQLPGDVCEDSRLSDAARARSVTEILDAYEPIWWQCDGEGGALFSDVADAALRRGLPLSKGSMRNALAHCAAMDEIAVALANVKWTVVQLAARDGLNCQYCRTPLTLDSLQIDHVIPRARGGGNELSNLVLACALCNNHKKAQNADAFKRSLQGGVHEH